MAGALFERMPVLLIGLPPLVLGTGWFLIALQAGDVSAFAPWVIIAANTLLAVPFALQILTPALADHFNATDRLAASLRLTGWQRLRIADVPALRRPLVQAFLLAFALSLGDLGVVTLFGSDQVLTFPALIYAKLGAYRTNDAAVLSLYLALFTGLAAILATIGTGRDRS
jgi:thiamine transport system permease protein